MSYESLIYAQAAGVATVTLNRPERFNAFDRVMATELQDVLARINGDQGVRAVVITGAGKAFLAGQDLTEVEDMRQAGTFRAYLERSWNPVVKALWDLDRPTIAAVNGPAIGAGAGLALACDLLYASERATFLLPFSKLGFIPDAGTTWLLPRLVGMPRALEIIYLAETIDADRALRLGLVNDVVEGDKLLDRANEVAARLAQGPTVALTTAKRAMRAATGLTYEQALAQEAALQDVAGRHPDAAEGVAAFLEKRPPNFGAR